MKTLKEKFGELSAKIKASGQPARVWFPQYTPASLLSAENWWEALAVCEYALDTKEDEKLTEDFFELIFSAFDCNVEVELNAEEYEFWWEKVMQVCDRVAEFSGAGWAQKGAQYSEARYGKRDMSYLFPYYEKAADMGWAEAEATVAYWRYMGFYCEQDKEEGERRFAALTSPEAILWGKHYRAFAEEFAGDKAKALQIRNELLAELPEGERLRAHVYASLGDALDRAEGNVAEEAAYYEKALEIVPNLYSLKNLATLYFRYPELNKPKELSFELWEKAWHAGVWSAANFLGYNYQEEEWLDMPKAIEWLEKGMLYCEPYSAYELALIYLYNDEYKNVERGLMCLNRCVEDDYIQGIEGLANIYFNGDLVPEDMNRAKELLEKAIELGSGSAAYRLGWMYERGFLSEEPDYVKALEFYEKAASLNNADGYCRVALYLANGYSGVKDPVKSREYYEKAAELGACFALVELAFLYENGDGVEKNYEKSFELISKAAEQGYPYAMFRVGLYMEKGVLGEVKPEEAFAWYTKAAEADDNDAIFALGRCYREGIGTEENWDRALEWFSKGAEKNEARCLTELGMAYENGNGVDFHMDYYNSFVIHPMLTDVLVVMKKHNIEGADFLDTQLKRHARYAEILERFISPEGSFPVVGRSICYRFGAFHALGQAALMHILPERVKPAQVRCALTSVIRRQLKSPANFDKNGWLRVGFTGEQIEISESYINTGSVYLCAFGLVPLGLPETDEFWSAPYTEWTNVKAWNGEKVQADHAIK